jgi:hypothetical protein
MQQFFREGIPMEHYCKFLDNLMANPSMTSRKELYLFLEAADLPITQDGCFLAYKAVRHDFLDKHSGTFSNKPGVTFSMPRAEVDDNRDVTCSYGFHAAAYEYARGFLGSTGDKMVAVKINPADVVSVPSDYNNQKLRTCKYTVMFEIPDAFDVFKDRAFFDTSRGPVATFDEADNSYTVDSLFDEDEEVREPITRDNLHDFSVFKVIADDHFEFEWGDELELARDDGTHNPLFRRTDDDMECFISLYRLVGTERK